MPHAEVELPLEDTELDNRNYDDEKQQVGGFGTPHGKIHIKQQINHDGEVNRARYGLQLPRWWPGLVTALSMGCVESCGCMCGDSIQRGEAWTGHACGRPYLSVLLTPIPAACCA